ncbi:MAG: tetratricopeptide repeat protein [Planctomycetota bacterium]
MLALATLLLAVSTAQAPVPSGRIVRLDASDVLIQADGRVALLAGRGRDLAGDIDAVGVHLASVLDRRPSIVDRRGIAWTRRGDEVDGRRDGVVVESYDVPAHPRRSKLTEDARGRIWFAAGDELVWFDGERWTRRAFEALRSENPRARPRIAASVGGERIYAWIGEGSGFVVAEGAGPTFTVVDRTRGLASRTVYELVPIGENHVLTRPGYRILAADTWRTVVPPHLRPPEPVRKWTRVVGRFELANDLRRRSTRDGTALLWSPRTLDWGAPPPDPTGHGVGIWRSRDPEREVLPGGMGSLIRVRRDGSVERASPVEEAFDPTIVDRLGGLWRYDRGARNGPTLARLVGAESRRLVEASNGAPAVVGRFAGVDAAGRAYFKTDVGWWQFDPDADRLPEPRFEWHAEPIEVWTAEREPEADARVRAAFLAGDYDEVGRIARWYRYVARIAPERLANAAVWAEVVAGGTYGDASARPSPLARTAVALGFDAEARRWIDAELTLLCDLPLELGWVRARSIARLADRFGDGPRALAAYCVMLSAIPASPDNAMARGLFEASRCAARFEDPELALAWVREAEIVGSGWNARDFALQRGALEALLSDRDDPAARVRFVQEYWRSGARKQTCRDDALKALDAIAATPDLDDALYVEAQRIHVEVLLEARRPLEAMERIEALASAGRHDHEALARLWVHVGRDRERRLGAMAEEPQTRPQAIKAFERAIRPLEDPDREGPAAREGRLAAATLHHDAGEHDLAIELLMPIIERAREHHGSAVGAMGADPFHAARLLSSCHEAKGELDAAIDHARAAVGELQPPEPRTLRVRAVTRRLETKLARLEKRRVEIR